VAQDVIITSDDCGTEAGIWFTEAGAKETGEKLDERLVGRYTARARSRPGPAKSWLTATRS
jgi:DNA-directed RNA polymerase beta' subunit